MAQLERKQVSSSRSFEKGKNAFTKDMLFGSIYWF